MTFRNTLLTAGLLALAVSAASAVPTIKLMRAGATQGAKADLVIMGMPDGSPLTGAVIELKFDTAKAAIAATAADFPPGAGWTRNDFSVTDNTVLIALSNPDGMTAPGPLCTVAVTNNSALGTVVTTGSGTNIADADFNQFDVPAGTAGPIITGKVKNLEAIPGSPAVGPNGLVAVGAGTKLYVLNADLSEAAGWAGGKELGGQVTGRPAFGTQNGAPVVVVGTANGNAAAFALDGTQITNGPVAGVTGIPSAPAVTDKTIVWAVQTASGTGLVGGNAVDTGAGTVTGSPAVFDNSIVAGKSSGILYARIEPSTGVITPQADASGITEAIGSPAVDRVGASAIAAGASGKVYKVNLATGAQVGTALDLAAGAPLSAPFVNYLTNKALFGGKDGKVYQVDVAALTGDSGTVLGSDTLSMPLVQNGKLVVADAKGKVGVPGGATQDVAGQTGAAIAATGPGASDSIVVTTTDGSVIAIPAF